MNYIEFFSQLFVLTFAIFAGLLLAFRLIWPKVESYVLKLNSINANRSFTKERQQLKFAAYERLILLTHRMEPVQVMLRHQDGAQSISQFKQSIISDIESEFQHNLTQQLYVTDSGWTAVNDLKDNTLALFRNVAKELPNNASVQHYIAAILKHMNDLEDNPYTTVQLLLKNELSA